VVSSAVDTAGSAPMVAASVGVTTAAGP
jgi:hypothetical protein